MGWFNPDVSWAELERQISGRTARDRPATNPDGDSAPGYSHRRPAYAAVAEGLVQPPENPTVPYAELHCHSNFSFLDGVNDPEELIEEAVRLGLDTMAITDHDGFYAASRFAEAAAAYPLRTIYGAELSLGLTEPQNGVADPEGQHLLVLASGISGYHRLSAAITEAQLRGDEKGRPIDSTVNDALARIAADSGLPLLASNNVHYATPANGRLAAAVAAVRARRSLADMDGWLPGPGAHLRSGVEMQRLFARYPGAVARTVEVADRCAFDLQLAKPKLPKQRVPLDHTPISWLRELCRRGADQRYAHIREEAEARLARELQVIEDKDFPGYFLIVHDMVAYARERGILCQGRGSAANSVVCYVLGITAVDPIKFELPFERFLSTTREEEPDIDVDFDSDRREEVIQEVYRRYGRHNAAQVANVISYRPKSAVRDMAKALGYSTGQQDAWSKQIDTYAQIADA